MSRIFAVLPLCFVLFHGCGSTSDVSLPPDIRVFSGRGFTSFQVEEYRTWILDSGWNSDSCSIMRLVSALCRKGLLTGKSFHYSAGDTNRLLTGRPFVFENHASIDEDFRAFRGKPTYIERAWMESIRRGSIVDTLFIGLSSDLTGKLPGPMSVFRLALTCSKSSNPCQGILYNTRVIALESRGMGL
jgi:hypothetical protein